MTKYNTLIEELKILTVTPDRLIRILRRIDTVCGVGEISKLQQGTLHSLLKTKAAEHVNGVIRGVVGRDRTTREQFESLRDIWQKLSDLNMLECTEAGNLKKHIYALIDASPHKGIAFHI